MGSNLLGRVVRTIINSFTFILLLIVAYVMWQGNPLLSLLLALAAVDQFEDVYYYVYRKRLFPPWLMPLDMIFEMIVIGIGLGMLIFSLIYYAYFETWFFRALLLLSIPIIYSATEDIIMWRQVPEAPSPPRVALATAVMHHVCPKKEVCEEKRFVRRKQQLHG